ncbi:hypothetical protein UJ101_00416 [Flavobacteriaceae bacterium UJ101]|nr:hypothetical protein UJ101_00416 [Flavobacteriaceae bacterium UJ101]
MCIFKNLNNVYDYVINMICRLILFSYFLFSINLYAQNLVHKGVPYMKNFDIVDYQGESKIWDISQGANGFLYFANGKKLLEYNGVDFQEIATKKSIIRSVYAVNNDSVFVGLDGDFGLFIKENDTWSYNSLYFTDKEEGEDVEEFWRIFKNGNKIVFQSFKNLYIFNGHISVKIPARNRFNWAFKLNDEIYISDRNNGLFKLENESLIAITKNKYTHDIKDGFLIKGKYYFVNYESEILELKEGILKPCLHNNFKTISLQNIFSVSKVGGNWAFGTVKNGLYIINEKLEIVQHFSKKNGLLNNTVLTIENDIEDNIWLGLDYGISYIKVNSNNTYFYDYFGLFGTAYTALKYKDDLYVGTNQGLYKARWDTLKSIYDFGMQIPMSDGQVWSLKQIDETVFVGHDKGTFVIEGGALNLISKELGAWKFLPLNNKNFAISGNYNGIVVYEKNNGKWSEKIKLAGFEESSRNLFIDINDNIWVGIKTKGIFKLKLNEAYDEIIDRDWYSIEEFEGSSLQFFYNNEELSLRNEYGQNFKYNIKNEKFEKTDAPIVIDYKNARYKLLVDQGIDLIDNQDTLKIEFLDNQVLTNIDNITPVADFMFFPIYNGFALYKNSNKFNKEMFIKLNPVIIKIESLISIKKIENIKAIEPTNTSLKVYFTLPFYGNDFKFQYKIDERDWSAPFSGSSLVLNELGYGDHQLRLRALYKKIVSKESSIQFKIDKPWYFRWYSILSFFLVVLIIIGTFIRIHQSRMRKQERLLILKRNRELIRQEQKFKENRLQQQKEIIGLENEKLKIELNSKNRELAKAAQVNLNKNSVVKKIKKKFIEINEASSQKLPKRYYKEMISTIEYYLSRDDDKIFEMNFDKTHDSFFKKLHEKHPSLTTKDLRTCAFLKMNLTSKEIASLLGINSSSVDVSRSRLRKKMHLDREDNLSEYLRKFN